MSAQFLEDSLSLVETEERLLAAEIIELDRMERSHLVRGLAPATPVPPIRSSAAVDSGLRVVWQACLAVLQNIQAIRKNRPKEELVRDSVEHEFRKQINNLNGSVSCDGVVSLPCCAYGV